MIPFVVSTAARVNSASVSTRLTVSAIVVSRATVSTPSIDVYIPNDFYSQLDIDISETFLCLTDFAETYIYRFKSGQTQPLNAIFNNETVGVDAGSGVQVILRQPSVIYKTIDLKQAPNRGDIIRVHGILSRNKIKWKKN